MTAPPSKRDSNRSSPDVASDPCHETVTSVVAIHVPPDGLVNAIDGSVVSTRNVTLAVAFSPIRSCATTVTVCAPSARPANVLDRDAPSFTKGGPARIVSKEVAFTPCQVTVTAEALRNAPLAGEVIATAGPTVSTTNATLAVALFPATSNAAPTTPGGPP